MYLAFSALFAFALDCHILGIADQLLSWVEFTSGGSAIGCCEVPGTGSRSIKTATAIQCSFGAWAVFKWGDPKIVIGVLENGFAFVCALCY